MVVVRFIGAPSGCHGEHHALAVLKGEGERGQTINAISFLRAMRHQRADICSAQARGVEWMSAGAEVAAACAQSRGGSNGRTGMFEAAGTSGGKAGAGAGAAQATLSGGGLPRNTLDASKMVARVRGEIGGLARLCGASRRLRGNRALRRAAAGSSVSLNVPGVITRWSMRWKRCRSQAGCEMSRKGAWKSQRGVGPASIRERSNVCRR